MLQPDAAGLTGRHDQRGFRQLLMMIIFWREIDQLLKSIFWIETGILYIMGN